MDKSGFHFRIGFFFDDAADYRTIGQAMQPIMPSPKLCQKEFAADAHWIDLWPLSNIIQKER